MTVVHLSVGANCASAFASPALIEVLPPRREVGPPHRVEIPGNGVLVDLGAELSSERQHYHLRCAQMAANFVSLSPCKRTKRSAGEFVVVEITDPIMERIRVIAQSLSPVAFIQILYGVAAEMADEGASVEELAEICGRICQQLEIEIDTRVH